MEFRTPTRGQRRAFLHVCLAAPASFVLAACAEQAAQTPTAPAQPTRAPAPTSVAAAPSPLPSATGAPTVVATAAPTEAAAAPTEAAQALAPTPECGDDDDEPTIAQTEGPYYTPNTPERTSLLEANMPGTRLTVSGTVVSTTCQPIARALLDFWHCDDAGVYDNEGYRLRGHQFADDSGSFQLETIVPGVYTGRTRHIHVKVQAPNQPVLTTQLYFPNEPQNARDGIYRPELLMDVQDNADGSKAASFTFVLETA